MVLWGSHRCLLLTPAEAPEEGPEGGVGSVTAVVSELVLGARARPLFPFLIAAVEVSTESHASPCHCFPLQMKKV